MNLQLLWHDKESRGYLVRRYLGGPAMRSLSRGLQILSPILPLSLFHIDKPIFVVGCSRSGTSIFTKFFSRHKELANWSEAALLFELDYYNPEIDHFKDRSSVNSADSVRIKVLLSLYLFVKRKRRLVNKHPQNSLRLEYLNELFPDAFFIHLIRDGRDVAHSNYRKAKEEQFRHLYPFGNFPKPIGWKDYLRLPPLTQFALQWRDVVEYVHATGTGILSNRFIEVKYEDFCTDPHLLLRQIDIFCGLRPGNRSITKIPRGFSSRNGQWRRELSEKQKHEAESTISESLARFGYI